MKRYYVRHTSLKGVISFKKIAELWNGDEVHTTIKGVEIIIHADDMGTFVFADTRQSLEDCGTYDFVKRGDNGEVGK